MISGDESLPEKIWGMPWASAKNYGIFIVCRFIAKLRLRKCSFLRYLENNGSLYLELNFVNAIRYSKVRNVLKKLQNHVIRAVLNHLIKFDVSWLHA